jgi:hypothetical protein
MKPTLTFGIVTKSQIYAHTIASLNKVITCPKLERKYFLKESLCVGRSDLPKARSVSLTEWYNEADEKDVFMFIDADQTFTPEDILLSLQNDS